MFVPSKAFRVFLGDSCLILLKNRDFCAHKNNSHFLPERDKIPIPIAVDQYTNFSGRPNFSEFLVYQKYGECSDYYRLSCLRQILFLMHCLLVLMKLSISISGLSHEKVILQWKQFKNKI